VSVFNDREPLILTARVDSPVQLGAVGAKLNWEKKQLLPQHQVFPLEKASTEVKLAQAVVRR
jgi:hypothetical protein